MRTRAKRLGPWKPYVPRDQHPGMGGDASLPASFAGCVVRMDKEGMLREKEPAAVKHPEKMPVIAYFRIEQCQGEDANKTLGAKKSGPFLIFVCLCEANGKVSKVERMISDVARLYGMKLPSEYATYQEALAVGLNAKRTWGKPVLSGLNCSSDGEQTFLYASDKVDVVTGTKPVTLFFNAEEYRLNGEWKNLPAQVCLALERACPGRLRTLVARGEVAGFATSEARFRRGQYVPEAQVWYEKNAPSREFVRQTRKLCILFGADLSHIKVTYVANGADESKTANRDAIFEAARRGRRALPGSVGAGDLNHEVVAAFEADLMESYASGFDFRETSRRLVEGRVGKAMTEAVAKALQARMFERKDGVWLFPQMVMDDAARVKMTARAKELLANEGAFASVRLRDESLCLRNFSTKRCLRFKRVC